MSSTFPPTPLSFPACHCGLLLRMSTRRAMSRSNMKPQTYSWTVDFCSCSFMLRLQNDCQQDGVMKQRVSVMGRLAPHGDDAAFPFDAHPLGNVNGIKRAHLVKC